MEQVFWKIRKNNVYGIIKNDIYGGFVEHLGRNVYGGVYDPDSSVADEDGFRKDVIDLIRELNMPVTRYPGGCYIDLERWEDSVGPVRKARLEPAWKQLEPNTFGLDEFMKWSKKVNTEILMTVNVADRTLADTLSLYEYCNFSGGTYWSDFRRSNGIEEPYNIKNWCIGNELYGTWEMGQMSAGEYGRIAREHAKLLKNLDPECRVIVCGTPDDMKWNETVLEFCGEYIDAISLHDVFFRAAEASEEDYLRVIDRFEMKLSETVKICKAYEAEHKKRIAISVDEWIIWDFNKRMHQEEKWTVGMHLLEQDYTILEALIAGAFFSCLHRHAADVDIACIAQSVNVIAPVRTENDGTSWKQTIFYPFALTSCYGRGISLAFDEMQNDKKNLYGSAVYCEKKNEITLFLTNRGREEIKFSADIPGACRVLESVIMHCADHNLTNKSGAEVISPVNIDTQLDGILNAVLAGCSWSMIRIAVE